MSPHSDRASSTRAPRMVCTLALLLVCLAAPSQAQWPGNGLNVSITGGGAPAMVSDGAGGAIIAWTGGLSGDASVPDIYAQHVLAPPGALVLDPAWPATGRALCTAAGTQWYPAIASDGAGGAIVTWSDFRGAPDADDIYAQHVLASGLVDPNWTANGTLLCNAANRQLSGVIVADGAGGAIVV